MLMSVFFLLCTFIGMVGTFWIRCNNRRGEIGIMKSMALRSLGFVAVSHRGMDAHHRGIPAGNTLAVERGMLWRLLPRGRHL